MYTIQNTDATVTTLPRVVQQANVSIVDDEICRLAYDGFEHKMDPTTMICAGYKEGGKDACQGNLILVVTTIFMTTVLCLQ